MAEDNGGSKFMYFLAGLGIGSLMALLFAPRSGEETRDLIAEKANKSKEYVTARGQEFRRQAEDLVDKGKDMVAQQKEQLQAALEAGKQAYQDEKSKSR
jgi:gas vesicle protein